MFSRILLTLFALFFATFMIVSNPLSAVAAHHEDAAAEEPAKGDEAAEDQEKEADEMLKPDEAAGDEAPKY
jgi:hypothetical protein